MLLGLAHDVTAVAERAGSPARDALGVGVQADAQEGVAFFGERAEAFEVSHGEQIVTMA